MAKRSSVIGIPAYFLRNINYRNYPVLVWITVFALKLFRTTNGIVGIGVIILILTLKVKILDLRYDEYFSVLFSLFFF